MTAVHFEAKKHGYRQTQDGIVVSFVVHPNDICAELAVAPLGTQYVVALAPYTEGPPRPVTSFFEELSTEQKEAVLAAPEPSPTPPVQEERERRPFHTLPRSTQAGMLCDDERFKEWLWPFTGDHRTNGPVDWPAYEVRKRCRVRSRADLDTDNAAGKRWDELVATFRADTGQSTWERPQ